MKRFLILSILILITTACQQKENGTTNGQSPFVAGGEYSKKLDKELKAYNKEEDSLQKIREANMTDIKFFETEYNFGNVKVGSQNKHYFVFQNVGKKPLIIESAHASCGCTMPFTPNHPIQPGKKDSILIQFNPYAGMEGTQEKVVNVKTNTYIPKNELFIHANIVE